jgi:hypothetical protein
MTPMPSSRAASFVVRTVSRTALTNWTGHPEPSSPTASSSASRASGERPTKPRIATTTMSAGKTTRTR